MAIETINPYTNKSVKKFDELSDAALENKIAQAEKAFGTWKTTPVKSRAELLHKVAALMLKKKEQLAGLITLEMGKLIAQSVGEIELSASIFEYYAKNAEKFLADKPLEVEEGSAFIRYSPIGIVLGVEPWNYPFYQIARIAAPNIAAGNVIMIKHASSVPQCAQAIQELFDEAGAAAGIYTNLFISSKKVAGLAADTRIKGLSLTGSEEAGASLAEASGKNLKKSVLELGGSDPFIVLEDADLEKAVAMAVEGRMGNMGQACTAAKRIIVVEEIADTFLEKFKQQITGLKVGDPADKTTQVGPLSSEGAAQHLDEQVQKSIKEGATLVMGGKRIDREGAFYEPSILTDLKPGMTAYHEELFGPVASFYRVKNEAEAIKLANDSPFGLGGAVFSKNIERAKKIADQIDTGMVYINEPTTSQPDLPFGGTKRSGYGRELSGLGIEEFVNKKLIRVSGK